jgi:hypothetical protein
MPRKAATPIITTGEQLRQSVIELRGIYSNLSLDEYCLMYERKYGVKSKEVKRILKESAKHE